MNTAMKVAIDRFGRLVLPKAVREEAGIEPGMSLFVRVRDGRVEMEPAWEAVRVIDRRGLPVAELVEPRPPLGEEKVREVRRALRSGRHP
ncbi:MAG: AbrB/MazE/SpoVT family DNA-binding domain-containing protein [Planctomycetes bacterium]|nr:AbrB/MazE/SpoVT family DNA-binding domain-containing protein [Planctomycetota bacterium]